MQISSLTPITAVAAAFLCLIFTLAPGNAGAPATNLAPVATLYAFSALSADKTNPDGAEPSAITLAPNGDLIGAAHAGGPHGTGTIFQITPAGDLTTLHGFSALQGLENANSDGAAPLSAPVLGPDGRYYGIASAGGSAGEGTVFALDSAGTMTTLYSFAAIEGMVNSNSGCAQPSGSLVPTGDGVLYGVASTGGDGGQGTIFSISPAGKFTTLYSFGLSTDMETNTDGGQPLGALVRGADGNFYGTSAAFGPGGAGSIFKITPGGQFTVVHSFLQLDDSGRNPDGAAPAAGLVIGPDGRFYGATLLGGRYDAGTIFRIDTGGQFAIMHVFSAAKGHNLANSDGANPRGPLLLASDGTLYGTTRSGGQNGTGTVFRISTDGEFETVCAFSALDKDGTNNDGAYPCGPLVEGKNGELYGTTAAGGPHGTGTIFDLALAGGTVR